MCRGVETIHVVRKSQSTFRVQLEPCGGAYRPCAAPRLPLLHARFRNLAKYPNRARAREAREGERIDEHDIVARDDPKLGEFVKSCLAKLSQGPDDLPNDVY